MHKTCEMHCTFVSVSKRRQHLTSNGRGEGWDVVNFEVQNIARTFKPIMSCQWISGNRWKAHTATVHTVNFLFDMLLWEFLMLHLITSNAKFHSNEQNLILIFRLLVYRNLSLMCFQWFPVRSLWIWQNGWTQWVKWGIKKRMATCNITVQIRFLSRTLRNQQNYLTYQLKSICSQRMRWICFESFQFKIEA